MCRPPPTGRTCRSPPCSSRCCGGWSASARASAPVGGGTAAGVALRLMAAAAGRAAAHDKSAEDPAFALKATLQTHLAYVEAGDKRIDDVSLAGLRGLTLVLNRRAAVEAEEPMA